MTVFNYTGIPEDNPAPYLETGDIIVFDKEGIDCPLIMSEVTGGLYTLISLNNTSNRFTEPLRSPDEVRQHLIGEGYTYKKAKSVNISLKF